MSERPVFARFQALAAQRGSAPVLASGEARLSHAALASLVEANRLALQAQGHGPGRRVGWLGDNTLEMLAALLACARIGAVFAPLDPALPSARLAERIAGIGLHALLATPEHAAQAAALRATVPWASTGDDGRLEPDDLLLAWTASGQALVHGQADLLAGVDAALAAGIVLPTDRVLAVLPLSQPIGLCLQALPALLCGAALRLQAGFDPAAWLADVAQWQPTTSALTASMLQALAEPLQDGAVAEAALASLRALYCVGGPVAEWAQGAPATRAAALVQVAPHGPWLAAGRAFA